MGITLNSTFAATISYAPYIITAGIATIAALAVIYFYMQSRKEALLTSEVTGPVMKPLTNKPSKQSTPDATVINEFIAKAREITPKTEFMKAHSIFNNAFSDALTHIKTCEGLVNLVPTFIEQAYCVRATTTSRTRESLQGNRQTQEYLNSCFKAIWNHPQAKAEDLLSCIILDTEKKAFKSAGINALGQKFKDTTNLDNKQQLAKDLIDLDAEGNFEEECKTLEIQILTEDFWCSGQSLTKKQEIFNRLVTLEAPVDTLKKDLTETAMRHKEWTLEGIPYHQGALNLHKDLYELLNLKSITVTDIADKVPDDLFSQQLIQEIKSLVGDTAKNQRLHKETDKMKEHFETHFTFKPVLEAFITFTKKIDTQAESNFNLSKPGEMERIIKTALWTDLLSLGANMGHRDLMIEMVGQETDLLLQ